MEGNGHPDLIHIGRILRERMDRTLEAEMEAARAAARRSRSIRDVLLACEDAGARVSITAGDGSLHNGTVLAVGSDHVELATAGAKRSVVLAHIVTVETAR